MCERIYTIYFDHEPLQIKSRRENCKTTAIKFNVPVLSILSITQYKMHYAKIRDLFRVLQQNLTEKRYDNYTLICNRPNDLTC